MADSYHFDDLLFSDKKTEPPPLSGHWFRVSFSDLDGVRVGGFTKVSGLNRSSEPKSFVEGGRNYNKVHLRGQASFGTVTLEYGVMDGTALWAWARSVDSGGTFRKDVRIELMSHSGKSTGRIYILLGAWPTKWTASDMDAQTAKMSVDTLELVFDDIQVDSPSSTVAVAPAVVKAMLSSETGVTVDVHYNPKNFSVTRTATWKGAAQEIGTVYSALKPTGGGEDSVTIDLLFDTSETADSVGDVAAELQSFILTDTSLNPPRPPLVEFTWGEIRFKGGVTSLTVDYTLFDDQGTPKRADVKLGMVGQLLSKGQSDEVKVAGEAQD